MKEYCARITNHSIAVRDFKSRTVDLFTFTKRNITCGRFITSLKWFGEQHLSIVRHAAKPNMSNSEAHYDDLVICNGQGVYKNGMSKLDEQLDQLKNYTKKGNEIQTRVIAEDEVLIYPNPASTEIIVDYNINSKEKATLIIYDLIGREQLRTTLLGSANKATINVNAFKTGVYLYKLCKQDKTNFTGKLIIE